MNKGPITNEAAASDLVEQAMADMAGFRGVINPELLVKFDALCDGFLEEDEAVLMRVMILAVSYGRRLERGEKKIVLANTLN